MDKTQLKTFVNYMIGMRPVGFSDCGDALEVPICPEIGDKMPRGGYACAYYPSEAKPLADLLREEADAMGR